MINSRFSAPEFLRAYIFFVNKNKQNIQRREREFCLNEIYLDKTQRDESHSDTIHFYDFKKQKIFSTYLLQ